MGSSSQRAAIGLAGAGARSFSRAIAFGEAQAHQPEGHHRERREGEDEEDRRAAHRLGQDVLLAEEEGAGGDEEGEAHPPQMPRDPLRGRELRAQDRIEIEQAGEQAHAGEREHRAGARRASSLP